MSAPEPKRLVFPPVTEQFGVGRPRVGFRCPALPEWPWEATMWTAAHCYLLWAFFWLQFVTTLAYFSYQGRNLGFYTASGEPFRLTIPESFLAFAVALSVFATCAVIGGTRRVPRLWKRLLAVLIFVAITVGFAILNLQLRHYSYQRALEARENLRRDYERKSASKMARDPFREWDWDWRAQEQRWYQWWLDDYDRNIRSYREKYGIEEQAEPR